MTVTHDRMLMMLCIATFIRFTCTHYLAAIFNTLCDDTHTGCSALADVAWVLAHVSDLLGG